MMIVDFLLCPHCVCNCTHIPTKLMVYKCDHHCDYWQHNCYHYIDYRENNQMFPVWVLPAASKMAASRSRLVSQKLVLENKLWRGGFTGHMGNNHGSTGHMGNNHGYTGQMANNHLCHLCPRHKIFLTTKIYDKGRLSLTGQNLFNVSSHIPQTHVQIPKDRYKHLFCDTIQYQCLKHSKVIALVVP